MYCGVMPAFPFRLGFQRYAASFRDTWPAELATDFGKWQHLTRRFSRRRCTSTFSVLQTEAEAYGWECVEAWLLSVDMLEQPHSDLTRAIATERLISDQHCITQTSLKLPLTGFLPTCKKLGGRFS